MLLSTTSNASAQVWTDQEDYTPGSTVTIHGENSDEIVYAPGETVLVNVTGPMATAPRARHRSPAMAWALGIAQLYYQAMKVQRAPIVPASG